MFVKGNGPFLIQTNGFRCVWLIFLASKKNPTHGMSSFQQYLTVLDRSVYVVLTAKASKVNKFIFQLLKRLSFHLKIIPSVINGPENIGLKPLWQNAQNVYGCFPGSAKFMTSVQCKLWYFEHTRQILLYINNFSFKQVFIKGPNWKGKCSY